MVNVRQATVSDIQVIREIAFATWPVAYGNILSSAQLEYMLELIYSTDALRKQMLELSHSFILAYQDSDALGFASYGIASPVDRKTMRLHKIYVLPSAKGSGIGKLLLDTVIGRAREAACTSVSLNVNRDNNAKTFYEKHGFYVSHEEDIDIGSGYFMNDFVMRRELER